MWSLRKVPTDGKSTAWGVNALGAVLFFWIYKMMDLWGNIPLVTDYSDKELPTNKPRQEVYSWLLSEVKDIADKLPAREGNYGKFTQGAAYSLLAVLYLNAEAWGVTCDGNAYQQVIDACDKVINMGYIIEPDNSINFAYQNKGCINHFFR